MRHACQLSGLYTGKRAAALGDQVLRQANADNRPPTWQEITDVLQTYPFQENTVRQSVMLPGITS